MGTKFRIGDRVRLMSRQVVLSDLHVLLPPHATTTGTIIAIESRSFMVTPHLFRDSSGFQYSTPKHRMKIRCATVVFDDPIHVCVYPIHDVKNAAMYTRDWHHVVEHEIVSQTTVVLPLKNLILDSSARLYESLMPGDLVFWGTKSVQSGIVIANNERHSIHKLITDRVIIVYDERGIKTVLSPRQKITVASPD